MGDWRDRGKRGTPTSLPRSRLPTSATSMPQMTMPGTTSRVWLTTASSAVFMSRAPMPGTPVTMPRFCRRLTPDAPIGPSCPVEETITLHSSTLGSMHILGGGRGGEGERGWARVGRRERAATHTSPPLASHLGVVVERDEGPVGDRARHLAADDGVVAHDKVLGGRRVEELDVGRGQDLGEQGGGEQGGVLDDDVVA